MQTLRDKLAEALDDKDHHADFTPQTDEDYYYALADAVLPLVERALAEQREGIAKAIEQANANDPQHCYDDTSWSLSRGYEISADEARRYGKNEENA